MLQRAGNPAQPLDPLDSLSEDRSLGKVREQAEREHILTVLRQTEGNRIRAAKILGVSRKTLWKKLKRLGLSWPPEPSGRDAG